MFPQVLLTLTLAACVYTDLTQRRIYNAVLLPSLLAAVLWHMWDQGWGGIFAAMVGAVTGLALLWLPFAAGGLGAGDVKLLATVGAWLGSAFAVRAALLGALVGGALALGTAARQRRLAAVLKDTGRGVAMLVATGGRLNPLPAMGESGPQPATIPYGLALALGAVMAFFWRW